MATMANKSMSIAIERVRKNYGPLTILDDISLNIAAGEFISLLGPSGSGKTTLLNIIAGFTRLDAGRVFFDDREVSLLPPHKRDLGIVFQNYALFPHMTIAANVAFPLRARDYPEDKARERVQWALDLVELGSFGGRKPSELSGGQRQRAALARAVVFEPKIILMDEPLSALDKQLRERMQIELRHLHKKLNATVVYVTHDQREALTMSDRIAVMNHGRILQVGSPRQIYDAPSDKFVASFIGESTLIPVVRQGEAVLLAGQRLLPANPLPDSAKLSLVLRSERLELLGPHQDAGINRLDGQVSEVVYQGDSVLLYVDIADGHRVAMRSVRNPEALPAVGTPVSLGLKAEHTVVIAS